MNISEVSVSHTIPSSSPNDLTDWSEMGTYLSTFSTELSELQNPAFAIDANFLSQVAHTAQQIMGEYELISNGGEGEMDATAAMQSYEPFFLQLLNAGESPSGPTFQAAVKNALKGDTGALSDFLKELQKEPTTLQNFIAAASKASSQFTNYTPPQDPSSSVPNWKMMATYLSTFSLELSEIQDPTKSPISMSQIAKTMQQIMLFYSSMQQGGAGSMDPAAASADYMPFFSQVLNVGSPTFQACVNQALKGNSANLVSFLTELAKDPTSQKMFIEATSKASDQFNSYSQ